MQAPQGQKGVDALLARLPDADQDAACVRHGRLPGRRDGCQPQSRILDPIMHM